MVAEADINNVTVTTISPSGSNLNFKSLMILKIKTEIKIIKKLLPCAPIIGVNPSIRVSANIVPEINQGNPVKR